MINLPTYSRLFEVERKLYKIFDWELPRPVGLLEAAAFMVTLVVIIIIMTLLGQGLTTGNAFIYVVPPGVAAWLTSQQFDLTDAKRPHRWLLAQLKYLIEPRHLVRLDSQSEPQRLRVERRYWQQLGADWLNPDSRIG
ncbi:MAG: conjugal transfer protein [Candidatus Dormibacteraceae bacterium]